MVYGADWNSDYNQNSEGKTYMQQVFKKMVITIDWSRMEVKNHVLSVFIQKILPYK